MRLIEQGGTALRFTWRILVRHRYAIVGIVAMVLSAWWLLGCSASTRVSPASNESKVTQTDTPTTEKIRIRTGEMTSGSINQRQTGGAGGSGGSDPAGGKFPSR